MIKINQKEKALVDCTNGEIHRPECFDSLVLYHSYLVGKGHSSFADRLLEDVVAGKKIITKMIKNTSKHGLI